MAPNRSGRLIRREESAYAASSSGASRRGMITTCPSESMLGEGEGLRWRSGTGAFESRGSSNQMRPRSSRVCSSRRIDSMMYASSITFPCRSLAEPVPAWAYEEFPDEPGWPTGLSTDLTFERRLLFHPMPLCQEWSLKASCDPISALRVESRPATVTSTCR